MASQPLDNLNPEGKVVNFLLIDGEQEPSAPGHGDNKEKRLRDLLSGMWGDDMTRLVAWIEDENCWYRWTAE